MTDVPATPPAEPGTTDTAPRAVATSVTLEVSNAFVRLLKAHYGKGPTSVRTHLLGDVVVVLTRGGYTQVEHTLSELGHPEAVLEQRRVFKEAMTDRFRAVVSEATGREVVAVLSATHVEPDIGCETFVLAPPGSATQD